MNSELGPTELLRTLARSTAAIAVISSSLLMGCKGSDEPQTNAPATSTGAGTPTGPGEQSPKGDAILIGEYGSMTGPTATFGTSTDNGVMLAVEKINAGGGVLGKQLEIIRRDDGGNANQARSVTEALVDQGVKAVIGEVASTLSLKGAPVCQDKKVPMVSPASTNPKVTQVGDYIFRVCFIDPLQGSAIAAIGTDVLHAKKAAILYDNGQDYSKGLRDVIAQKFPQKGGTIVAQLSYSSSDADFSGQLTSIKNAAPDVIFVPGYYTEVAKIARQARELGIQIPLVGGDGWDSEKLTENAGDALNGCYFTNHFSAEDTNPVVQGFVKEYQKKYSKAPDAMAALGYDAVGVVADAIKRAKSTDGPALRDALAATKGFKGITGSISINAERNAVKPLTVIKIVDRKFKFLRWVQP